MCSTKAKKERLQNGWATLYLEQLAPFLGFGHGHIYGCMQLRTCSVPGQGAE